MAAQRKTEPVAQSHPLRIIRHYRPLTIPIKRLQQIANRMYRAERLPLSQKVVVVFCSDHLIRKLNLRYRKIDRATDVLSFTMGDADFLGEIYISLQRAAVQSRRYHSTYNNEIARLFVHGFYHLLGYDHNTAPERRNMEQKEKNMLNLM
jgi:probable rRNA maturation factor